MAGSFLIALLCQVLSWTVLEKRTKRHMPPPLELRAAILSKPSSMLSALLSHEDFCGGDRATEASLVKTRKTNVSWR